MNDLRPIEEQNNFLENLQFRHIQQELLPRMSCFSYRGALKKLVDKAASSRNSTSHSKLLSRDDFLRKGNELQQSLENCIRQYDRFNAKNEFDTQFVEALRGFKRKSARIRKNTDEITGTYKELGADIILPKNSDAFGRIESHNSTTQANFDET